MTQKNLNLLFLIGKPFSPIYSKLMEIRAFLYQKGYLHSWNAPCPIISVGNITLGGTGKTPHVISIARYIKKKGLRPAIVSRGYGGRAGKGPLVVTDGKKILLSHEIAGDEPAMLSQILSEVPIIVGSDRCTGCKIAYHDFHADIILLDDGFQHMAVHRDMDIVLLSSRKPFGTGRLFPGGDLREPVSALNRASVVLLTNAEFLSEEEAQLKKMEIHSLFPNTPVFLSKNMITGILSLNGHRLSNNEFHMKNFFAFSGIANHENFLNNLRQYGVRITGSLEFSDHHPYKISDLKRIMEMACTHKATSLITTRKDAVKIKSMWEDLMEENHFLPLSLWLFESKSMPEDGFWYYIDGKLGFLS